MKRWIQYIKTAAAAGTVGLQRVVIDGVITDSCWAYQAGSHTAVKYAADWQLGSVTPFQTLSSPSTGSDSGRVGVFASSMCNRRHGWIRWPCNTACPMPIGLGARFMREAAG